LPRQQSNPEREIRGLGNVVNKNLELRLELAIVNVVNVGFVILPDAEDSVLHRVPRIVLP